MLKEFRQFLDKQGFLTADAKKGSGDKVINKEILELSKKYCDKLFTTLTPGKKSSRPAKDQSPDSIAGSPTTTEKIIVPLKKRAIPESSQSRSSQTTK